VRRYWFSRANANGRPFNLAEFIVVGAGSSSFSALTRASGSICEAQISNAIHLLGPQCGRYAARVRRCQRLARVASAGQIIKQMTTSSCLVGAASELAHCRPSSAGSWFRVCRSSIPR